MMSQKKAMLVKLEASGKFQRLLAGIPETCGMKSGHVKLLAGESVGEHKTEGKEEAIVVLEGAIEVYIAGSRIYTAQQGTVVYIPPQTTHDVKNNGVVAARYIYVVVPVQE
jgi:quercetin dioxygenase-like cupin family protein